MNYLIVVDMQVDFVNGALGTKEAQAIVPAVERCIRSAINKGAKVIFTRDTHFKNYLSTQEGRNLPVPHCIKDTPGWQIIPELQSFCTHVIDKPTFGSTCLMEMLRSEHEEAPVSSITLIGICTDICVISNAMLLKAAMPEVEIRVNADCCAGVTPESHENALSAMKMCQIQVV
jgi:nicotinamidase-related amidase